MTTRTKVPHAAGRVTYKKQSKALDVWRRLRKNRGAIIGLIIIVVIILTAILCPLFLDYEQDIVKQNISERLQFPSLQHLLGTDTLGRDLFARIVWGARASVGIGFASVAIALIVGGVIGAVAGFWGGGVDMLLMRIMDVFLAIPATLLAIAIVAAFGGSIRNLIIALAISMVPNMARVTRGSVMTARDQEYVEAARAIGDSKLVILFCHVLPNSLAPVIVQTTLSVASAILITAGLSFIGLGVEAPMPEWGSLRSSGRECIRTHGYLSVFPGVAIMLTILSLNLLGDGLRDALDPRLK